MYYRTWRQWRKRGDSNVKKTMMAEEKKWLGKTAGRRRGDSKTAVT